MSDDSIYKAGDYLEFGEGDSYSRGLVLHGNTVIVKSGPGTGSIISVDEWLDRASISKYSLRRTDYFAPVPLPTVLRTPSIAGIDDPYATIRTPTLKGILKTPSTVSFLSIEPQATIRTPSIKGILRTPSAVSSLSIEPPATVRSQTSKTHVPKKLPWYYTVFLCGIFDD